MSLRLIRQLQGRKLRQGLDWLLFVALGLIVAGALSAAAGIVSLGVLFVVVSLCIGALYSVLRRSLPRFSGVIKVAGIRAPVEIRRDSNAVPHIYAQHKLDAWFGLGYAHAQDRLWQMEMQRRLSQGRLSEVLGRPGIAADRFTRTLGLHRAAQQAWDILPDSTRNVVLAYTAGINSFIAAHGQRLSLEWRLLRCQPELWGGPDVLASVKLMALNLGFSYELKLLRYDLMQTLGPELAELVMEGYPQYEPIPAVAAAGQQAGGPIDALSATLGSLGLEGLGAGGVGSNAWAVSGARSASGKPLLANDPHLMASFPTLWYMAYLEAEELAVGGATIPGLPGVVSGRNRLIAWGITNLNPDVQDLFWERLSPTGEHAEFQGQIEPLTIVNETIKVRGQADVQLAVRISRHGPLISDALNAANAAQIESGGLAARDPLALCWTAFDQDDTTLAAFIGINEAPDWDSFRRALRLCVAPAVNFVYADAAGHIGYQAAGRIPIRANGDGSVPGPGWTGDHEWVGSVPFEALPSSYDPPEQMIVSANNCPISADYPYFLGRGWHPPFRAQRIADQLQATAQHTIDSFTALQADTISLFARELAPALLALVHPRDQRAQQAADLLARWDGDTCGASAAGALFAAWVAQLPRTLLEPDVMIQPIRLYERSFLFSSRFLIAVVCEQRQPWFDRLTAAQPDGVSKLDAAFCAAITQLTQQLGPEMETWRWDKLHNLVFPHQPFHAVARLRSVFSRSLPHGGDWSTVNFGPFLSDGTFRQTMVASYRQVVDLSNPNIAFIFAGGQSGNACSTRYDDYLADWHDVRLRTLCFEPPASNNSELHLYDEENIHDP